MLLLIILQRKTTLNLNMAKNVSRIRQKPWICTKMSNLSYNVLLIMQSKHVLIARGKVNDVFHESSWRESVF